MTRIHWLAIKIYLFLIIGYFLFSNQIILIPMLSENTAVKPVEVQSKTIYPKNAQHSAIECNGKRIQKKVEPKKTLVESPTKKWIQTSQVTPQPAPLAKTPKQNLAPLQAKKVVEKAIEKEQIISKQIQIPPVTTRDKASLTLKVPALGPFPSEKNSLIEQPLQRLKQQGEKNKWSAKKFNLRDVQGETALSQAVENNDIDVIRFLLKGGADPNLTVEASSCNTAAFHCKLSAPPISFVKSIEALQLLLKAGADPNLEDSAFYSPLFYALLQGDHAVVQLLIDVGVELQLDRKTMLAVQLNPKIVPLVTGFFPEKKALIQKRAGQKKAVEYFTFH